MPTADALAREVDRLVRQVSGWTPSRWAALAGAGRTRADVVAGLVRDLAELGRQAGTGVPAGVLPAAVGPHALAAQVVVLAGDLVDAAAADPPGTPGPAGAALDTATERVREARRALDGR